MAVDSVLRYRPYNHDRGGDKLKGITIGQVAKASNINIETVRYYERRGLIPEPPRNESGYRMFSKEAIQDIKFIKRAQGLGFTLEEIKKLLSASNDEESLKVEELYDYEKEKIKKLLTASNDEESFKAEELYDYATEKIQEIESKIREFNNMKSLLEDVARKCPGPGVPRNQCSIIKKLTEGENENG